MKKKKTIYLFINLIMFSIIIYYLFFANNNIFDVNIKYMLFAIIPFLCIHLLRIVRQYIILMENKIKISRLTRAYLKSSLTNTVVPFKIGELFKIYLYGYEMNNYKKSFIGVLVDKFFDALLLLIILITAEIYYAQPLSIITILLLIFTGLVIIFYISFENTYNFLNKYLILNKNSELCIKCLKILDEAKNIFFDVKDMIKDRVILILSLTMLSWIFEIWFVSIISRAINVNSGFIDFINYMNNSFIGIPNELSIYYILVTIILFIAFYVLFGISKLFKES